MSSIPHISIQDLDLSYGKHLVVSINQLQINNHGLIAVIGRNGSGKSTLLKCLAGLQHPQTGAINIFGKSLYHINATQRAKLISFVGTHPVNVPQLRVYDLIAGGRAPFTSVLHNLKDSDYLQISHAIELLGLSQLQFRKLNELSDGERQKCMIARACAQNTPIMILDEPTAFLDYPSRRELLDNLKMLVEKEKKCIIFSSHDLELSLPKADAIWFLHDKKLITGTTETLQKTQAFNNFLQ